MINFDIRKCVLVIGLVLLSMPNSLVVHAQSTESFNKTVAIGSGEITAPTLQSFTLPLFDPSMGKLTGVTLTYAYRQQINFLVTNHDQILSDPAESFTHGWDTVYVGISGPDGTNWAVGTGEGFYDGTVPAGTSIAFGGGDINYTISTAVPLANLNIYKGANSSGQFAVFVPNGLMQASGNGTGFRNGADLTYQPRTTVSGIATVTYTYTPSSTPEPGTAPYLAACGLVAVCIIRRRYL